MKKELNLGDKISIPEKIHIIERADGILVVSPETAKWILLRDRNHLEYLDLFRENSVGVVLKKNPEREFEILRIIYQIKRMQFDVFEVKSCVGNKGYPLHFYLTNGCNMRCPHCYMYSGEKLKNELTTEEICAALDGFYGIGSRKVTFSGGEVTTRKDFLQIVKHAHKLGFSISILTNGISWSELLIEEVAPLIKSVQVSIDGFDEESNSVVRGKGSFKKALQTIERFYSRGVEVEVGVTPFYSPVLKNDLVKYADFIKKLTKRFDGGKFKVSIAKDLVKGRSIDLSEQQLEEYGSLIDKLYCLIHKEDVSALSFAKAFSKNVIMDECMYGFCSVAADGEVYPCAQISKIRSIGNVKSMDFSQIRENSKYAERLSNINNLRPCRDCDLKYICGGGCRIKHFSTFRLNKSILEIHPEDIAPRKCDDKIKNHFYDLMVSSVKLMCGDVL